MAKVTLRQSGGAEIISIPKAIGRTLGLTVGAELNLSVVDNRIVLEPVVGPELTLEAVLKGSPKERFAPTAEDLEWLNAKPVGRES